MATQFYPQMVKEAIDTIVNLALYPKKTLHKWVLEKLQLVSYWEVVKLDKKF